MIFHRDSVSTYYNHKSKKKHIAISHLQKQKNIEQINELDISVYHIKSLRPLQTLGNNCIYYNSLLFIIIYDNISCPQATVMIIEFKFRALIGPLVNNTCQSQSGSQ